MSGGKPTLAHGLGAVLSRSSCTWAGSWRAVAAQFVKTSPDLTPNGGSDAKPCQTLRLILPGLGGLWVRFFRV